MVKFQDAPAAETLGETETVVRVTNDGIVDASTPEDDADSSTASAQDAPLRGVAFETATDELADLFDLDERAGETITSLDTTTVDGTQQLVATVERRRRTALRTRFAAARRTGRRVGTVAGVVGVTAAALSLYRRVRGRSETGAEVSVTEEASTDE
jgi:hypothetical protein